MSGRHRRGSEVQGAELPSQVEPRIETLSTPGMPGSGVLESGVAGRAAEPPDLGRAASRGVLTALASRWGRTATLLVSSVVLARLLTPDDFGLVAMLAIITGLVTLFQDLGLTTAVVRARSVTPAQQVTIFLVNLALGVALSVGLYLAAPLVAAFYGRDELVGLTRVLAITFVINALSGQARADLQRNLRFSVIAIAEVVIGVLYLVVAVVLALLGARYWSLVGATLASSVVWTITLVVASTFRWVRPAPVREVRTLLVQGGQITAVQAATYFSQTLDVVAVGRFFGAGPVGLYNRAAQVVTLAESQLTAAVTSVALPVLSRVQDDPARFRSLVLRAVRAMGYSLVPLFTILSLVAQPAVALVYGPQWTEAGSLLVVLALAGTVRSLLLLMELAATALGLMGRQLSMALTTQVFSGIALVVAAQHSLRTVAITYVVATVVSVVVGSWWITRGTPVDLGAAGRVFAVPAASWGAAYLVARLVVEILGTGPGWTSSFIAVLVELAVAVGAWAVFPRVRSDLREVAQIGRRALSRG